jgi:hypothetical protein
MSTNGHLTCEDLRRVTNDQCCDPCHKSFQRVESGVEVSPGPPEDDPDCSILAVYCCGMDKKNRTKDNFELALLAKQEATATGGK